jgi:hypothetical protein
VLFSVYSRGAAWGSCSVRTVETYSKEIGANATMGMWLEQQQLVQRNVTPIVLSGANGEPL